MCETTSGQMKTVQRSLFSMGLWSSIIITTILILIAWELRDIKGLLSRVLEHLDEENDEKEE